jgi:hypothetical protein
MYIGIELEGIFNLKNNKINDLLTEVSEYHKGHFKEFVFNNQQMSLKIETDGSVNLMREDNISGEELYYYRPVEIIFKKAKYKDNICNLEAFLSAIWINKKDCIFNRTTGAHVHISFSKRLIKNKKTNSFFNEAVYNKFTEIFEKTKKLRESIKEHAFRNYAKKYDPCNNFKYYLLDRYSAISTNNQYNTIELRFINLKSIDNSNEAVKQIKEQIDLFITALLKSKKAKPIKQEFKININNKKTIIKERF